MLDCYNFKLTNIRPFEDDVLVEMQPATQSGAIHLPEFINAGAGGIVKHEGEKFPGQEAIVRKVGKDNSDFQVGSRVIIPARAGRQLNQEPRVFRLVKAAEVLAVFV